MPTSSPTPSAIPTLAATMRPSPLPPTLTPRPTVTPTATLSPTPALPVLAVGDRPFRFIGAFVASWDGGDDAWNNEVSDDLLQTAKASGIRVVELNMPPIENPLGVYIEAELAKLDYFLDSAARQGVYVMLPFIHAYGMTLSTDDPFYHPAGIEALMNDPRLAQALKNRIQMLITRKNTVNGKIYRDDPTIMAWLVCDEPISAPWNYKSPPKVTTAQLRTWLGEMATYIKTLDPNHLVSVNTTAALGNLGEDWVTALDVPALDFIYPEDADMRVLNIFQGHTASGYSAPLFSLKKPVVTMLSFTSGVWDQALCRDWTRQAQLLKDGTRQYLAMGARGVIVFAWASTRYRSAPEADACFTYNAMTQPVVQMLQDVARELNPSGDPKPPLSFVKMRR